MLPIHPATVIFAILATVIAFYGGPNLLSYVDDVEEIHQTKPPTIEDALDVEAGELIQKEERETHETPQTHLPKEESETLPKDR